MDIRRHLEALELELSDNSTRNNPERLSALLADDFQEFGSSGTVYTKREIIVALQSAPAVRLSHSQMDVKLVAEAAALVTYRSHMYSEDGMTTTTSIRSSLWARRGTQWQLIFHQGTRLPQ